MSLTFERKIKVEVKSFYGMKSVVLFVFSKVTTLWGGLLIFPL